MRAEYITISHFEFCRIVGLVNLYNFVTLKQVANPQVLDILRRHIPIQQH
jgi:hypothetical protein